MYQYSEPDTFIAVVLRGYAVLRSTVKAPLFTAEAHLVCILRCDPLSVPSLLVVDIWRCSIAR